VQDVVMHSTVEATINIFQHNRSCAPTPFNPSMFKQNWWLGEWCGVLWGSVCSIHQIILSWRKIQFFCRGRVMWAEC